MSQKYISDFTIIRTESLGSMYQRIVLKAPESNPEILSDIRPGQFVQIRVDNSKNTFLRRPISINDVDTDKKTITILVRRAGDGTRALSDLPVNSLVNIILPLGNSFSLELGKDTKVLLIGGGVGVAPLLYLGKLLTAKGIHPHFLLAAKTADALLLLDEFKAIGTVYTATDDGSMGEKGLVTEHSVLRDMDYNRVYCCGPMPMMKGIAAICKQADVACEVSLENVMACGLGACLCCVEPTVSGNRCACTDGPVFNINELLW